jgi:hypothetical protein
VQIPYWWDKLTSSLAATLYQVRPDLFLEPPQGTPIPPTAAPVTESLTPPSQLMLHTNVTKNVDPAGWWMSPQYSGIRAFWDGNKLITSLGRELNPPPEFVAQLPNFALDCMLL